MPHALVLPLALLALQGDRNGVGDEGLSADSSSSFASGVRTAIRGGGCCASRAIVVGACLAARYGDVPSAWVGRVRNGQQLLDLAVHLACLRK
jgi:hypothetical protein